MTTVFWFTKDLRLQDNVALNAAVKAGAARVAPVYLFNAAEYAELAGIRQHSLTESLRALNETLSGALSVVTDLVSAAKSLGAKRVFATRLYDPVGKAMQLREGKALAEIGIDLFLLDSQYAVAPGSVAKPDGTPYRVYTPFYKAWSAHGWQEPQVLPSVDAWIPLDGFSGEAALPVPTRKSPIVVKAGEAFALRTWERFKVHALDGYYEDRNRADLSGTSHLSHALAFGEIHPRTLLAQLNMESKDQGHFAKELAWREFYADVLWHNPTSLTDYYVPRFANMRYDTGPTAEARLEAWKQGKTGYPMVDAGMRQLLATGWMHNRVRMIVASFLVKDLHLEWQQGAEWFEQNLSDFDPASNTHGWQWTAGCGTDASPYYRVFNPVLQGLKFDPNGEYVRKYVPELAHLPGAAAHTPWDVFRGYAEGYPDRIVDHDTERHEALARLEEIKVPE
jgi:deoxyribodipyrimidine photo-lyase